MSGGGGGGSNEKYVQEQYDYDVKKWKYDKQEMKDAYTYAQETHKINMQNAEDQINFQNQERLNAWAEKMEIRTHTYNGEVAAYNASKKSMYEQLDFNNQAAELAMGDNVRKYNERLMEIGFQNEDLLMKYDQQFAKTQLGLDQAFGQEQMKLAQAGESSRLALGQAEDTAVRKVTQAKESKALKERGVGLQVTDKVAQAGFQTRALIQGIQAAEAKGAHEIRNLSINGMQSIGKTLAGGQAGRSMRKALQAHMAETGRATSAVIDSVTRERSSYNLNLDKVAHTLNMAQGQANLSYDQLAQDVMHLQQAEQEGVNQLMNQQQLKLNQQRQASQYNLDQLQAREELGMDQLAAQTDFGIKQLDTSIDSARAQAAADGKQLQLQKYQQDLNARNSLAAKPVLPPGPSKPVELPTPTMQAPAEPPSDEQWQQLHPIKGAVSKGPSGFMQALTAVGAIAGMAAPFMGGSDDRFKYNLNRVGTSPSGIPKYTFKYRLDGPHGPTWTGTSAQDLLAMGRADAVFQKEKDGFYYVDYGKLDVKMEVVTT